MEWQLDQKETTYIFRYYLPCAPICDRETIDRRMDELVDYCVKYKVTAAMLYVDLNPYWYYMPDDLDHTKYYVEVVKELAAKLRRHSISYQLNYQNLIGAWDGGADLDYVNQWENYVDELGKESRGCACNIGERFREAAGTKLRLWAETKPDVIWIDDDIRFHNHRTAVRDLWAGKIPSDRCDYGCFCDKHIDLFNKKHNSSYTRKEIVDGILNGENYNEMRRKWLDFSGECANEIAAWIEDTIHAVSPETRTAVMTSSPDVHSVEGRDWGTFLSCISGNGRPLLRPTFGPYMEGSPMDFFTSYILIEILKASIKAQYKDEFDFCPEIENTRFTRWAKSIAGTGYQIMLSAFLGCKGVTLSIYDLEGCILEEEPEFGELLLKKRAFADNMAETDLWNWESEGVALITSPDRISAPHNERRCAQMIQLAVGRFWDVTLVKAGIPCKYVTPDQVENCTCVALDRYTAELLSGDEIRTLLGKGVLLDAGGAEDLIRRGFGEYLGVTIGNKVHCIAASEVLHRCLRSDGTKARVPSRINGNKWNELVLEGAEALSSLVTPYGTEFPGFTRFENRLGGIVYIYAGNGALGDGFYSNYRVKMLKEICNDMAGGKMFRMNNASYALMAVKSDVQTAESYVFISNMSADRMQDVVLEVPYDVKQALIVDADGREYEAKVDGSKVSCENINLNLYDAFVCKISFE